MAYFITGQSGSVTLDLGFFIAGALDEVYHSSNDGGLPLTGFLIALAVDLLYHRSNRVALRPSFLIALAVELLYHRSSRVALRPSFFIAGAVITE